MPWIRSLPLALFLHPWLMSTIVNLASFLLLTGWLLCAGLLLSMGQGFRHLETSTGLSTWLQCFFFSLLTKTNQGLIVSSQYSAPLFIFFTCLFFLSIPGHKEEKAGRTFTNLLPILSCESCHRNEVKGVREDIYKEQMSVAEPPAIPGCKYPQKYRYYSTVPSLAVSSLL